MFKAFIAIAGILLLILGTNLKNSVTQGEKLALSKDKTQRGYGIVMGDLPPCNWTVVPPERVINQSKSAALVIKTTNSANKPCSTVLSIRAPGFDIKPLKEDQQVSLPPKTDGSISWIITPRVPGTYDIAVTDVINTKIYGITVKDLYGLTAPQAHVLSSAGSLFGPMFTIPWWFEWLRRRKEKQQAPSVTS